MQDRTALVVSGIRLRSQAQQVFHNQWLVGSSCHQERCLKVTIKSAWTPRALPSEIRSPLPRLQKSGHLALTLPLCSRISSCRYICNTSAAAYAAQRSPRAANRCRSLGRGGGGGAAMRTAFTYRQARGLHHPVRLYSRVSFFILGQQLLGPQSQYVSSGCLQGGSSGRRQLWGS